MYVMINYVIICSYYKLRLDGHTIIVDEIFNKNIYIFNHFKIQPVTVDREGSHLIGVVSFI